MHIELDLDDLEEAVALYLKSKGLDIAIPNGIEIDRENDVVLIGLDVPARSTS
jgi:hypothetical protein